jgi:hypothetical protein
MVVIRKRRGGKNMWYKKEEGTLNYNEPIIAYKQYISKGMMLLPSNTNRVTYDWFDMKTGNYSTQMRYQKPEEAVKDICKEDFKICNVNLKVTKS